MTSTYLMFLGVQSKGKDNPEQGPNFIIERLKHFLKFACSLSGSNLRKEVKGGEENGQQSTLM